MTRSVTGEALWWPPNKLAGRYLAPYLSSQVGEAADVMPHRECAPPVESPLDPTTPAMQRAYGELSELAPPTAGPGPGTHHETR